MLQPEMRSSIGRKAGEGMTQTHVPYGYRIEDGKALADEVAAEKLKSFFNESKGNEQTLIFRQGFGPAFLSLCGHA